MIFEAIGLIALIFIGAYFYNKTKKLDQNQEQFEKVKANEIAKAIEKMDSGNIDDLVREHNSEITDRDKKGS